MRLQHNIAALNTNRNLNFNNTKLNKSLEKLSSGYKINRAGDDAAGLAISEKMRGQIRGLDMAQKNTQDSISLIQTAEGALNEVHAMLQRGRELAVQAANDSNTNEDRQELQKEIVQLKEEINAIAERTEFNARKLLKDPADLNAVGLNDPNTRKFVENLEGYMLETAEEMVYNAFGIEPKPGSSITIKLDEQTGQSYNAYVQRTNSTTMDMVFNVPNMLRNSGGTYEPDTTVSHEMVHAVMAMSGMDFNNLPSWFVEGTAEYVSGGLDRVKAYLGSSPTDADVSNFIANFDTVPYSNFSGKEYAAGFLATWYMDEKLKAGGSNLATVVQRLANNSSMSLDAAMKSVMTGYGVNELINDFRAIGTGKGVNFIQSLDFNKVGSILDPNGSATQQSIVPDTPNPIDDSDGFKFVWDSSTGFNSTYIPGQKETLVFHVGANSSQNMELDLPTISTRSLNIRSASVSSQRSSDRAIAIFDKAINKVSNDRSYLGAMQNRLEHTMNNLSNTAENLTAAESRIRDTDMASEMMNFTKQNILMQAAQGMLAQANQQPQGVLQILG